MIKSFLMIGQSNMAGRGNVNEVPPIYNERIKMLRNGQWQMMTEPINYDRPVAGVGLAASFASAWCCDNTEDTIGLIPCAEGGSVIDEWHIDGTLFKHAVSEAKFAMNNSELAGILWHQGESDSCNGNYKDYYQKLLVIVEALRLELKAQNVPFIIGGLGDFLGKLGFGKSCTEYTLINQELQKFADEQDNCYYVTATNLTANPDGIHIDAKSQRKFGIRYYEAFHNKRHILEVLPNEEQLVIDKCNKEYTKSEMMYIHILDLSLGKITYPEFESKLKEMNNQI